LYVLEILINP